MATKEGQAPAGDKEIAVKPKGGALATAEDTQKLDQLLSARNMTQQQFQVLRDVIHPNASSAASVLMAFDYCRARNLDPFKKVVHIVPAWSKKTGGLVDTIWPGIAEVRTTAHRTGTYLGCDEVVFGPDITREFSPKVTVTFPAWAQMTVYKSVGGQRIAFPGPKVRWLEEYATEKHDSVVPNSMWQQRPYGQIEKCCEAAALRKAWPEETDMTAEEMAGKVLDDAGDAYEEAPPEPSVKEVKMETKIEAKTESKPKTETKPKPKEVTKQAEEAKPEPKQEGQIVLKLPEVSQPEEVQDAEVVEDNKEEAEEDDSYTKAPLAAPTKPKAGDIKWS